MISKDNFTDSNTIFIPSKLILTYLNHVSRYFWTWQLILTFTKSLPNMMGLWAENKIGNYLFDWDSDSLYVLSNTLYATIAGEM